MKGQAPLVSLEAQVPEAQRLQWMNALATPKAEEAISRMEWLQPPRRRSQEGLDYLKSLGVADFETD